MPRLENILKPLHGDALGKLQIYTHSVYQWVTTVCAPLPFSAGEGALSLLPNLKNVTYRISVFRGGLLGKRGEAFWGDGARGLQFLYKK